MAKLELEKYLEDLPYSIADEVVKIFDANAGEHLLKAISPFVLAYTGEDGGKLRDSATFQNIGSGHVQLIWDAVDRYGRQYASFAYNHDPYSIVPSTAGTYSVWDQNPFGDDDNFDARCSALIDAYIEEALKRVK